MYCGPAAMAYFVYVLESQTTGRLYVGSAGNVEARLSEHNRGNVDSTRPHGPWKVVYTEEHLDRSAATRREREIKSKKSRKWIEYHLLNRSSPGL